MFFVFWGFFDEPEFHPYSRIGEFLVETSITSGIYQIPWVMKHKEGTQKDQFSQCQGPQEVEIPLSFCQYTEGMWSIERRDWNLYITKEKLGNISLFKNLLLICVIFSY